MSSSTRWPGIACALGGVIWCLTLLLDPVSGGAVRDTEARFRTWEAVILIAQVLLLIGVVGLAVSGAISDSWLGKTGLGLALIGRVVFILAEIHSIIRADDDTPLLPLGALLTAVGMLLTGIAVLQAHRWLGWHRWTPLLTGLYPFVAMFPFVALTDEPSMVTIALWGLLWILLGIALDAEARETPHPARATALDSAPTR